MCVFTSWCVLVCRLYMEGASRVYVWWVLVCRVKREPWPLLSRVWLGCCFEMEGESRVCVCVCVVPGVCAGW